jgi:hypothetical protein
MSGISAADKKQATSDRSRKSRLIICTLDVNSFFINFIINFIHQLFTSARSRKR